MLKTAKAVALALGCFTLAACEMQLPIDPETGQPIYPQDVVAALPPGVPPSIAFIAEDGCWAYSIEVSDTGAGYPLYDRQGQRVCDPETKARVDAANGVTS